MADSQTPDLPDEKPDHPDDETPKLTEEEWAYVQAVVDAEKAKGGGD